MTESGASVLAVVLTMSIQLALAGCEGPVGPTGTPGEAGTPGTMGTPGEPGAPGTPGAPAVVPLDLEPSGLVGRVTDGTGLAVAGGTVYLIPAADVAALQRMTIDLTLSPAETAASTFDEPLEDLIDSSGSTYTSVEVDAAGVYRLTTLPAGTFFVAWVPAPSDALHLPGGDSCRAAAQSTALVGAQLDIRVSGNGTEAARYVGSSSCLSCHGRHRTFRTAHRVGIAPIGSRGYLQDTASWPDFDVPATAFEADTTLYYYACDGAASGFSKCRVSDVDPTIATPSVITSFTVRMRRDLARPVGTPGAYYVELTNLLDPETARYDVVLTYGGAVFKQRLVTRRLNANGTYTHLILPVQYNVAGNDAYPSSNDWRWRDYHSEQWFDHTTGRLREPGNDRSFDNSCAGCHFTGFGLEGSEVAGWNATSVPDPSGDYDFDGDGRLDELNVGCESCHGPGSEHLEQSPRGSHIVSPSYLLPGREMAICGSCHSRPQGIGAGGTDAPLSADLRMPRPGIRRAEFALGHTQRVDGSASNFHASGDSSSHHQQYSDFIRSDMYRNGSVLMVCSSCHDPHGNDQNEHQLYTAANDNRGCTGCHSEADYTSPREHVATQTGNRHEGLEDDDLVCTTCHMVGTASSGARRPGLRDALPSSATPVAYFQGDIASHRFNVPDRSLATMQPVAVTHACGLCHATFLPNP